MPTKAAGIQRIKDSALLLPELIIRGLAANDRVKYYLTLLQAAQAHAASPHQPAPTLRMQREASGVEDTALDHAVEGSVERASHSVYIPGACAIVGSLFEELRLMLQPLRAAGAAQSDLRGRVEVYQRRLDDLVTHAPSCIDDQLAAATITTLTRLAENGHDTLHRLVIDLHWELNRLQTSVSIESIDGARVYGVLEGERGLVRAFMRGLNETAALKFDHPGLATTATHETDRLTIHNDLGMAPAHVVVIHVAGLSATVTYTDVHHARVAFLQEMLQPYDVQWAGSAGAAGAEYEMAVGRYTAETADRLERYLTFLGSRLVFLIDWNRARKRLARLVGKSEALGLLKWAADKNIGHMAFLQCGDIRFVEAALERVSSLSLPPGGRLDEWLGREAARSFLMSVLRVTSAGLLAGDAQGRIEDLIDAELRPLLQTSDRHVFGEAADHATMISALTDHMRETLAQLAGREGRNETARAADDAHGGPRGTDQIARQPARREPGAADAHQLKPLWRDADRAADAIEEAAFLLTLVPATIDAKTLSLLDSIADLVALSLREYARCLDECRELSAASHPAQVDSFLVTIDRLIDLGRQARTAKRAITERVMHGQGDFHELFLVASIAQAFERAAMALSHCGPVLRDYVLGTWLKR